MSPDYIFKLFNQYYNTSFSIKNFIPIFIIAMLVLSIKNKLTQYSIFMFFITLSFIQLVNFNFFGGLISPHSVILAFTEFGEILDTLNSVLYIFIAPSISVIPAIIIIYLLIKKLHVPATQSNKPLLVFTLLLLVLPIKASLSNSSKRFEANIKSYSIKNSLYSISYFLGKDLPKYLFADNTLKKQQNYKPYVSKQQKLQKNDLINIVIIIGESLTYERMSLFDYNRTTTPHLTALKNNINFAYKKTISSAVSTKVSIPMLLNLQRNPKNFNPLIGFKNNLLTLAKKQNFTTHVYSKQDNTAIASYMPIKYVDYFKTMVDYDDEQMNGFDTDLLKDLKNVNFNKNNLIILHQRACHSPYEKNYPTNFEKYKYKKSNFQQYISNSYDNSVLFTDYFINEAIKIIKEKSTTTNHKTFLFFTPDHAEMLGQRGKYGHTILDLDVAKVPFIYYGINNNLAKEIMNTKDIFTHYRISKLIAKSLGFNIINPNEDNKIYINGNDLTGEKGFMTYDKTELMNLL